jgi:hypothetical protein
MALDPKIGAAARNAAVDGVVDRVDAGASAGTTQIRSGPPPATPATANSGTLLATLTHSDPAFGAGGATVVGRADSVTITGAAAVANGTAGHYRTFDSNGVCHLQGTAGEAADTTDLTIDDKDLVIGGLVNITSYQVTMPEQ